MIQKENSVFETYDFQAFGHIRYFVSCIPELYKAQAGAFRKLGLHPSLLAYLETNDFYGFLENDLIFPILDHHAKSQSQV